MHDFSAHSVKVTGLNPLGEPPSSCTVHTSVRQTPTASPSFSPEDPHPLLPGAPSLLHLGQRLLPLPLTGGGHPRGCPCSSGIPGAHRMAAEAGSQPRLVLVSSPPPAGSAAIRGWTGGGHSETFSGLAGDPWISTASLT